MKLISMTDLVLQGYNINQINNYAKFLKQPLKIEMFVPFDYDGNVLEEPNINDFKSELFCPTGNCQAYRYEVEIYLQAKEKVLFKGFKYCKKSNTVRNQVFIFSEQMIKEFTIEDLVKYDLTLTQSAINNLGL